MLLAKGLKIKLGDAVVIVATNLDGLANNKQFIFSGQAFATVIGPLIVPVLIMALKFQNKYFSR